MSNRHRLTSLRRFFLEYTDELHQVSINDIVEALKKDDIIVDPKTIRKDIEFLIDEGIDIISIKEKVTKYYVGQRYFESSELITLLDAISAAQFINKTKTEILQEKLLKSVSTYEREDYKNHINMLNSVKKTNALLYYGIDTINQGISKGLPITFNYIYYNEKLEEVYKHNKKNYKVSPYMLLWNNDRFYLIAYSHTDEQIRSYRVDRMRNVEILDAEFIPLLTDVNDYLENQFTMYSGKKVDIHLLCRRSDIDHIVDKFGIDGIKLSKYDSRYLLCETKVQLSPTFYSWIFQFQGNIIIKGPEEAKKGFNDMLNKMIEGN